MKISSLIDIIKGELKSSPFISFIYNIKISAKKVNEGDLYIAKNDKDLSLAIKNGAFAIVYDFETVILDKEIAWIKVDSYKNALIKIFRYKLSTIDLKAYCCNTISYELLNIYKNKNYKFISSNLENSIKVIENIKDNDILFCPNKELLNSIYPKNYNFNLENILVKNKTEHSLFETSFTYNNIYFPRLKLPSIYLKEFLCVYKFLEEDFDSSKLKLFNNMKALFLDKNAYICEHGRSDRFIISQKDISLIHDEISFINEKFSYAKIIYITNKFIKNFNHEQHVISNLKNLQNFLKIQNFNCLYLIGFDYHKVEKSLMKPTFQTSLF